MNYFTSLTPYTPKTEDCIVLHCRISKEDYNFIQTVCPLQGAVQFLCATIIHETVKSLKQNGITTYNPDQFIAQVRRCTNSPTSGPQPQSNGSTNPNTVCPTDSTTSSAGDSSQRTKQRVGIFDAKFPKIK